MEPLTTIGIIIIGILLFSFTKVFSVLVKVVFYALLVALFAVLFFDVTLQQVMDWGLGVVLWAL